jgi:hypothetical protein
VLDLRKAPALRKDMMNLEVPSFSSKGTRALLSPFQPFRARVYALDRAGDLLPALSIVRRGSDPPASSQAHLSSETDRSNRSALLQHSPDEIASFGHVVNQSNNSPAITAAISKSSLALAVA